MDNLQGGAYLASGKFKCLFDNSDFIQYFLDERGNSLGKVKCFNGQATVIAEKRELDKEQLFDTTLQERLNNTPMICLAHATLALIPKKRFTLSPEGVAIFKQVAKVSSQNCQNLFSDPTHLQAVCMDQGIPLARSSVVQTICKTLVSQHPVATLSSQQAAPLVGQFLCHIALGLKVLLDAHILHGDIKVNNVLMYENPQLIRRYEVECVPNAPTTQSTNVVGRQLTFQLIDFGKSQTQERFLSGGHRVFARKSMRAWYNPLCLGFELLNKDMQHSELKRWMPELFQHIDKYAFMFVIWQLTQSSDELDEQGNYWDAATFNAELFRLIAECSAPLPSRIVAQALARVKQESWVTSSSDFREFMLNSDFVWFRSWEEIYLVVRKWAKKYNATQTNKVLPPTLRGLAAYACPGILN